MKISSQSDKLILEIVIFNNDDTLLLWEIEHCNCQYYCLGV